MEYWPLNKGDDSDDDGGGDGGDNGDNDLTCSLCDNFLFLCNLPLFARDYSRLGGIP